MTSQVRAVNWADFVNTEMHGVLAGGLNGGILSSLEILVLRGAHGASLRRLPFLPYLDTLGSELHNLCTTSCFPTSPESDKSRIGTGYEHP